MTFIFSILFYHHIFLQLDKLRFTQKKVKENRERALNPRHPYRKSRMGLGRLEESMVSICKVVGIQF